MKSKFKKAVKTAVHVIAIVFLIFVVAVFVLSKISGNPVFIFGKTTMWVTTDSMNDTIPARTYILVEKVDASEIKKGDIIAFYSTDPAIYGKINTHRIVSEDGEPWVTKGDNNFNDDGQYSAKPENLVGRYVKTLPVMTVFGRIILSDVGFVLVIAVFLAVVLICYIPDIKNALKDKENEPEIDEDAKKEIDRLVAEEMKKLQESRAVKDGNSSVSETDDET